MTKHSDTLRRVFYHTKVIAPAKPDTMPAKPTRRTLARQWELLRLLPSAGAGKSALELTEEINAIGFAVSKRQIERDMQELREAFDLDCNDKSMPYGWKWAKNASVDFPGLTLAEALSLRIVKDTVKVQLSPAILQALESRFAQADKKLTSLTLDAAMADWPNKVRCVVPTLTLLAPTLSADVLKDVQDALLANEQLEGDYLAMDASTPKTMRLHPLALVNRGPVTYLVATVWDYTDVRLVALHRITNVKRLYEPVQRPADFNLDTYIASGALQFGSGETLRLEARVSDGLARILSETALSADQTIKDGVLAATVQDSWQLNWWLLSQGDAITVMGPKVLREKVLGALQRALAAYGDGGVDENENGL